MYKIGGEFMLVFNPKRMLEMRGVERMFNFLCKSGFIQTTASQFLTRKIKSVKIEHIERLCRRLNCTPNDLFEWQTGANDDLPAEHALKSLIKTDTKPFNYKALLKDIPVEKLPEVENLLKGLKDG
jgi:DNA-binding Xre family transcriptional regulator